MKALLLTTALLISASMFAQKRFITIDSTKICINTIGIENRKQGQPVIVFESGHGTPMGHWERVLDGVSKLAPLITYDRPGIGESEPDNEMPTIKNVADKLIKILNHLKIEPPYVLVGHSLGGAYVRGFAVYYPEMLAGLIIIDPADFTEDKINRRVYYEEIGMSKERVDEMMQAIYYGPPNLTVPQSIQEESQVLGELRESEFKEIKQTPLPKDLPVHILTGGRFDMPERMRSKEFDEEAVFRVKMRNRVARWTDVIQSVDKGMLFYSGDAGHFVHYDDPELLISSVRIVLQDYGMLSNKSKHEDTGI
jgi:pimeloyl-ACP methyl ester carboxylesterase